MRRRRRGGNSIAQEGRECGIRRRLSAGGNPGGGGGVDGGGERRFSVPLSVCGGHATESTSSTALTQARTLFCETGMNVNGAWLGVCGGLLDSGGGG